MIVFRILRDEDIQIGRIIQPEEIRELALFGEIVEPQPVMVMREVSFNDYLAAGNENDGRDQEYRYFEVSTD